MSKLQLSIFSLTSVVFSFIMTFSFYIFSQMKFSVINFIILILTFLILCFLSFLSFCLFNKRRAIFSCALGVLFSAMLLIGREIYITHSVSILNFYFFFKFLGISLFFYVFISLCYYVLPKINNKLSSMQLNKRMNIYFKPSYKYILIVSLVIFICWFPCFLASFPGVFSYDAPHQYWQFSNGTISNNQPIISSAILYFIMNLGYFIFGNYEAGLALFILLQMAFGAFVLAYSCNFLAKIHCAPIIQIFIIAFLGLVPVNALMAVNATKDTLYSYFFVFFIVIIFEAIYDYDRFFHSPLLMARFVLIVLLQEFYRLNGIYIILLTIPILLIIFRKYMLKMFIIICISIVPFYIITGPVYFMLGVSSYNVSEMFSIPVQQMVCAYSNNSEKLSDTQVSTMFEILPYKSPEDYKTAYHDRNSDYIRPTFKTSQFKSNPMKYIKNYISIGMTCPKDYINAFLNLTLGYWYPEMNLPDKDIYPQTYIEYTNSTYPTISVMTKRYDLIPLLGEFYRGIAEKGSYKDIPVISYIFRIGFISWGLLFIWIYLFYKRQYITALTLFPLLFLWLTAIAGPCVLLRYVFALFLLFPFYIGIIFSHRITG